MFTILPKKPVKQDRQSFTDFPKLRLSYEDFKVITETTSSTVFEASSRNSREKHMIRVLDASKEYVRKNYDHAAALFNQELLRLHQLHPGFVLFDTLETGQDGKQIAVATLPYIQLSTLYENKEIVNFNDVRVVEKFITDIFSDVQFLWKNPGARNILEVLGPDNICLIKEKGAFFLSNWAKIFESRIRKFSASAVIQVAVRKEQKLSSQELAGEIRALALIVLKLNKIDFSEIEIMRQKHDVDPKLYELEVRQMVSKSFGDSKKLQNLLERILALDPRNLPRLGELNISVPEIQFPAILVSKGSEYAIEKKPAGAKTSRTSGNVIILDLGLYLYFLFLILLYENNVSDK